VKCVKLTASKSNMIGGVFFFFFKCFQLFKLGPVQSVCISEGSDSCKEVWKIILRL
jgi:hypothetical protein